MNKEKVICLFLAVLMLTSIVIPINVYADDQFIEEYYVEDYPEEYYDDDYSEWPWNEDYIENDQSTETLYEDTFSDDDSDIALQDPFFNNEILTLEDAATFDSALPTEITENPADYNGPVDGTAEFHVAATGTDLSYQWEMSVDNGTTWKATGADGNKTDTLSFQATKKRSGYMVRCVVSNTGGSVTSDTAKINFAVFTIAYTDYEVTYQIINDTNEVIVKEYSGTATNVSIPVEVSNNGKTYAVTKIGDRAFKDQTAIESITLPNAITVIGVQAFSGCTSLSRMNTSDT